MTADTGITKARVETLTDGIYAIAMTLLVLAVNVPVVPAGLSPETALPGLMGGVASSILACGFAFMILLSFWMAHERIFRRIVALDHAFTNIVLIALLGIVLVPFSTMFMADYPEVPLACWVFALNLGGLGLIQALQVGYLVRHPELLESPITPRHARRALARSFSTPAAAAIAVLLSFVVPAYATTAYLLIPVFLSLSDRMWSR
jgi:uncharacterized membrane protein